MGFVLICLTNFLFFTSFYMLLPVLPVYLMDVLHAGKSVTGVLLSIYVLAALSIRPFSGYIVDSYPRKLVFLLCAFFYAATFSFYLWIDVLLLFGLLRAVHGMGFGMINTSATTLVVDMLPRSRLGAGIGFFGITTAVTMALGPMLGLLLYEHTSPMGVFYTAFGIALSGALLGLAVPASRTRTNAAAPDSTTHNSATPESTTLRASTVSSAAKGPSASLENPSAPPAQQPDAATKTPGKANDTRTFWEKLFLKNAGSAALGLACVGVVYGLVLNYISVFARDVELTVNIGYFFCLLALGMVISRLFSGRFLDSGGLGKVIVFGKLITVASVLLLVLVSAEWCFFLSAVLLGVGMGVLIPAYQTLFIHLAPAEQRGTANSSFFISWDGGIGVALFTGGFIAELTSFSSLFLMGAALLGLAIIFFVRVISPHYERNSLRARG